MRNLLSGIWDALKWCCARIASVLQGELSAKRLFFVSVVSLVMTFGWFVFTFGGGVIFLFHIAKGRVIPLTMFLLLAVAGVVTWLVSALTKKYLRMAVDRYGYKRAMTVGYIIITVILYAASYAFFSACSSIVMVSHGAPHIVFEILRSRLQSVGVHPFDPMTSLGYMGHSLAFGEALGGDLATFFGLNLVEWFTGGRGSGDAVES